MRSMIAFINRQLMSEDLPFESRILNFVCVYGAVASAGAVVTRILAGLPLYTAAPLMSMIAVIAVIFLISIKRAKNAATLTAVLVIGVSIVFWPVLFFTDGGPDSGMTAYFSMAILLDFTLLQGKRRTFVLSMTVLVTAICYLMTLYFNVSVLPEGGLTTHQLFVDELQSIIIVGFLMGAIIMFQTKLYQHEKNKAEAAMAERNDSLSQLQSAQLTLSAMFDANPHTNILFDSKFKVIDCNPAACQLLGFETQEDLMGGFIDLMRRSIPQFQPDGRPSIPLSERLVTATKEGYMKFVTELHLPGDVVRNLDVDFKKIPYKDDFAIVAYIYDMTEIHEREMELKRRDKQLLT